MQVLAMVQDVKENYNNLKVILGKLQVSAVQCYTVHQGPSASGPQCICLAPHCARVH
jgi:hypothetical protein